MAFNLNALTILSGFHHPGEKEWIDGIVIISFRNVALIHKTSSLYCNECIHCNMVISQRHSQVENLNFTHSCFMMCTPLHSNCHMLASSAIPTACPCAQMTYASFLIDHSDLMGLRQAFMGSKYTEPGLSKSTVYKVVQQCNQFNRNLRNTHRLATKYTEPGLSKGTVYKVVQKIIKNLRITQICHLSLTCSCPLT
jgi:hypothetical protein